MREKANIVAIAIAVGAASAIAVAVYTFFAYFFGFGIEAQVILIDFFPGYSLSLAGAVIGMVWAFSLGYLFSALIVWFYNRLNDKG